MFEADTVWTYEKYRRAAWEVWLKINKIKRLGVMLVLLFIAGLIILLCGDVPFGVGIMVASVAMPVSLYFIYESNLKKAYKSNKLLQGATVHFTFYEDHFDIRSEDGTGHVKYRDLFKLFETDKSFYAMTSNRIFFMIEKEKCSIPLINFIRNIECQPS
ncbi:YcxB-like protein [Lachnospiraceae bacterium]|nr:YcxB-like protein [Lachnospiraceae bacterium]